MKKGEEGAERTDLNDRVKDDDIVESTRSTREREQEKKRRRERNWGRREIKRGRRERKRGTIREKGRLLSSPVSSVWLLWLQTYILSHARTQAPPPNTHTCTH